MEHIDAILKIFETGQKAVNIECSFSEHEALIQVMKSFFELRRFAVLGKDDAMYDFMNVKNYLEFFADVSGSQVDLYEVIALFQLERLLLTKIAKLSTSEKRRVLIARGLMVNPELMVIEEPLLEVDRESSKIIVSAIEALSEKGIYILCTSNSFRTVSLLPGNSYHIKEGVLVPIFESLDFVPVGAENLASAVIEIKHEGRTLLVPVEDILFAESIDSVCHVYVKNSYVSTQFTLEELELRLKDYNFFRSHRSYLVNVGCVSEIQQWTRNSYVLVLKGLDGLEIPLSKRRYSDFKEQLHSA